MGRKKKKKKTTSYRSIDKNAAVEYEYHLPVLLKKSVDYLITDSEALYIDGTLGGGGHAAEIIQRLSSGGKLVAFDKDEEAIRFCQTKFKDELEKGDGSRILIINDGFDKACSTERIECKAKGLLLDLGVSSRQLDSESGGFSYRSNSRLNMRFGSIGNTAEDLLNAASEEELTGILRKYGDEPFAKPIARRIVEIRRGVPLSHTFQLRDIVINSVPARFKYKSLSRVFQAVRIAVNGELDVLENTLSGILDRLEPGARIVIISYHSLEDRIVKTFFKEHTLKFLRKTSTDTEDLTKSIPKLKIVTSKPILPDNSEVEANPRARSAKMRVAEFVSE